jgi:hypothetical protein
VDASRSSGQSAAKETYEVLIKETDSGWFWRVAQDWQNGCGWSGVVESKERAVEDAHERLKQAVADD